MKSLKDKIEVVLEDYPQTRNSDIALTVKLWEVYYPEKLKDINGRVMVAVDDLYDLPREDNVKRYRAKIQNDELRFLPTSLEVARQRRINEDVWRARMGQPTIPKRIEL